MGNTVCVINATQLYIFFCQQFINALPIYVVIAILLHAFSPAIVDIFDHYYTIICAVLCCMAFLLYHADIKYLYSIANNYCTGSKGTEFPCQEK